MTLLLSEICWIIDLPPWQNRPSSGRVARSWQVAMAVPLRQTSATSARHPSYSVTAQIRKIFFTVHHHSSCNTCVATDRPFNKIKNLYYLFPSTEYKSFILHLTTYIILEFWNHNDRTLRPTTVRDDTNLCLSRIFRCIASEGRIETPSRILYHEWRSGYCMARSLA